MGVDDQRGRLSEVLSADAALLGAVSKKVARAL